MGITGWWAEILSFSVAVSTQKLRAALVGNRADPTGSASIELQRPAVALSGLMPASGVVAPVLQEPRFTAEAGLQGSVAAELQQPITALAGAGAQVGTSAVTLQRSTAALTGVQTQSGSMAAALTKAVWAATGEQAVTGIQYIDGNAQTGATLTTMPTHQAGDLLLGWAYRDNSLTSPTLPAGWTNILSGGGGNGNSRRCANKIATSSSETSGTWTNATGLVILVYRNAGLTDNTRQVSGTGNSSTLNYAALTLQAVDGSSWIVRFAGHNTATNLLTNTPAGYTARAGVATDVRGIDSNGAVASNPTAQTQSVNTSAGWITVTVEIPSA
jgi:hypothetical protein